MFQYHWNRTIDITSPYFYLMSSRYQNLFKEDIMKNPMASLIVILTIITALSAQSNPTIVSINGARLAPSGGYYSKEQAEAQVIRFTKVKERGKRRAIIGSALTATGIILCATADWETKSTSSGSEKSTNDPAGAIGTLMLLPGIPIALTGFIQLGVGTAKIEEYSNLFKDTNISMNIGRERVGLTLTRNF